MDELKINGYAVLEDLIPVDKIEQMHAAFMPLLEYVRERESKSPSSEEHGDLRTGHGRMQLPHRYTLNVPWMPPFSDPEVYENPVLLEFLERYWGTDDFHITCYHSNNPYPGTEFQHWHRDGGISRLTPHVGLETCPHFGIKFPLVDTSEENGSIEVLPSTQYLADPALEQRYDEVLLKGNFPSSHRLNMKKGTTWIQDPRTLHRGTPNRADHPRPELVICYSLPWFAMKRQIEMSQAQFDALSERGKKLLSRKKIVD